MAYNRHIIEIVNVQERAINLTRDNCIKKYGPNLMSNEPIYNETLKTLMCPPFFDTVLCWPQQLPNTVASLPCPSHVFGFIKTNQATRRCMENGLWYMRYGNSTYTNYTQCSASSHVTIFANKSFISSFNQSNSISTVSPDSLHLIKILSEIGYTLSLISLLIAFIIMFRIKHLRCPRNIMHMNLFASFILRAFMNLLKDVLFVNGAGLSKDVISRNGLTYFHVDASSNNFECKLIISLIRYFTLANYSWLLMEGLFLYNLIIRALIFDPTGSLPYYICCGWGVPFLVVIPWIIARLFIEDTLCWTTHADISVYLILTIPTLTSVVVNFILFIMISSVLYKKLKCPMSGESKMYLQWAKSTLLLVPLFGINYTTCLIFYITNEEFIWLLCDSFLGSFQGFFVSILYCFLNEEVKSELKPRMKNFLTFLMTNNITKYCFPCREKYMSSTIGRPSVCTTMSFSSLYNKNRAITKTKSEDQKIKNLPIALFLSNNNEANPLKIQQSTNLERAIYEKDPLDFCIILHNNKLDVQSDDEIHLTME